jgi:hypothetical protein
VGDHVAGSVDGIDWGFFRQRERCRLRLSLTFFLDRIRDQFGAFALAIQTERASGEGFANRPAACECMERSAVRSSAVSLRSCCFKCLTLRGSPWTNQRARSMLTNHAGRKSTHPHFRRSERVLREAPYPRHAYRVSLIVGNLAEGVSESELLASFPQLSWKTSEPPSLTARLPRRRRGEMERSETRHGD